MQPPKMPEASIVNSPETYQQMLVHLATQDTIAIDTESNSLHAYHERVCLIQLSSTERDFLLDPFAFKDLSDLGSLFARSDIQKIFHAGDYDIACLKRDFDFTFHNIFDTMLAATALAEPNLGFAALIEKYFDLILDKKYQRANWGERPLKAEMLSYAQCDSHFLLPLRDTLLPQLEASNRLQLVLEDSEGMARLVKPLAQHIEDIWRVKGAQDLSAEALSLLDALNHMRELIASKRDIPPFKVLSDRALIEIAQTQPHYIEELSLLPSLPERQVRRYGSLLMQTIQTWRENPQKISPRRNHRLSDAEMKRRDALSDWRKQTGMDEGLPSNAIISRDLLDRLAHLEISDSNELKQAMKFFPYRYERYGTAIFEVLERTKE
jgi:ribonuclease D